MITIGHLAKTYGILPSEVASRATTYDLMVTDVLTTWENYQRNPDSMNNFSQEQLAEIVKRGRE
jgi:hypothetical protein